MYQTLWLPYPHFYPFLLNPTFQYSSLDHIIIWQHDLANSKSILQSLVQWFEQLAPTYPKQTGGIGVSTMCAADQSYHNHPKSPAVAVCLNRPRDISQTCDDETDKLKCKSHQQTQTNTQHIKTMLKCLQSCWCKISCESQLRHNANTRTRSSTANTKTFHFWLLIDQYIDAEPSADAPTHVSYYIYLASTGTLSAAKPLGRDFVRRDKYVMFIDVCLRDHVWWRWWCAVSNYCPWLVAQQMWEIITIICVTFQVPPEAGLFLWQPTNARFHPKIPNSCPNFPAESHSIHYCRKFPVILVPITFLRAPPPSIYILPASHKLTYPTNGPGPDYGFFFLVTHPPPLSQVAFRQAMCGSIIAKSRPLVAILGADCPRNITRHGEDHDSRVASRDAEREPWITFRETIAFPLYIPPGLRTRFVTRRQWIGEIFRHLRETLPTFDHTACVCLVDYICV